MWRADSLEKALTFGKTEEDKGATEDEIVGWHHWLNGHKFEQTAWDSEGQGSLVCCSSWVHKESDMIEWLNNKLSSSLQKGDPKHSKLKKIKRHRDLEQMKEYGKNPQDQKKMKKK